MLEHWVELDRMQSPSVVLGEEQIVDVELDRGRCFSRSGAGTCRLGRARSGIWLWRPSGIPSGDAAAVAGPVAGNPKDERKTRNALPKVKILGGWQDVLKKLIERFPLTLQDVKGGKPPSPALPYKLAANPSQFSALVMGRKKAIEWGRAMAMRDAYSDAVLTGLTEDVTMLTTADIFSWLHTNGHFRGAWQRSRKKDLQILNTGFCHVCGLAYRLHSVINDPIGGAVKSELRNSIEFNGVGDSFVCHITPTEWQLKRMPMIDISRLLPWRPRNLAPSTTLIVPLNAPEHKRSEATRGATWESRARDFLHSPTPN
ncbi:hypothetical protein B0H10DRAFT_127570 [Mycena sp. CBHHK59/15]|nr:hypothetical protein B0H10DRAFT_127570 [Mycena sp. CBHHK59/15]